MLPLVVLIHPPSGISQHIVLLSLPHATSENADCGEVSFVGGDLDEQTRQAIDVSTAMKIYESKGLQDVGKSVMIERAGATKIIIENITKPAGDEN